MTTLDIVLGLLLCFGLIGGLRNGLLVELASLLSLLAGIYVAMKFSQFAKKLIEPHVSWQPEMISIAAFLLTFILVAVGISLLAQVLTKVAGITGMGIFNTVFGGIFGVFKMVLVLSIALHFYVKFYPVSADQSVMTAPLMSVGGFIYPALEEIFLAGADTIK